MKEIENREDIEMLVNTFYEKVRKDSVIGYIFNDVAKVDWDHHLPVMYDFWETMVLDAGKYKGNAMTPHIELNRKEPLKKEHFERWLELFTGTVDELFTGAAAAEAKKKATSIAALMEYKVKESSRF